LRKIILQNARTFEKSRLGLITQTAIDREDRRVVRSVVRANVRRAARARVTNRQQFERAPDVPSAIYFENAGVRMWKGTTVH